MNNENLESQDQGISLADIFRLLRINWILIVSFTFVAMLAAGFYSFTMVPNKYKSSSEMMVFMYSTGSNVDPDNPIYDLNASRLFIDTAIGIIKSDYVINEVRIDAEENNVEIPGYLRNSDIVRNISVTSSSTSFIIKVSFISEDETFAQDMANLITSVTVKLLQEDFNGNFIKLTDASTPEDDSPNKILYTIVGAMAGAILAVGIVFLKQLIRNTYMSKDELEKGTGIQVLGVIPEFQVKERRK
ncbi:YveK family protein [Acholeplasma hippikon]|nr:Wzz/FepE/Etk N-terminal domain-containing protein [Acholeplasma hippikon]